jgi:CheY-like chemotaxis protein
MAGQSILIVDDEANQRLMLSQALRAIVDDLVIETAGSVREALDAIARQRPSLLITDYTMGGLTGLDLIAYVRRHQPGLPIIVITAYNSSDLQEAVAQLQVDHCLTKPVPLQLLRRIVAGALLPLAVPPAAFSS